MHDRISQKYQSGFARLLEKSKKNAVGVQVEAYD